MKKITSILIGLLYIGIASAQTYHPMIKEGNKYWDVMHSDVNGPPCQPAHGYKAFFDGDSIVNGETYKILKAYSIEPITPPCYPFYVNTNNSYPIELMREDTLTRKVYILDRSNNTENLMYDFSLAVGDTFTSDYATDNYPYVIDSITTVTLPNGETRNRWHFGMFGTANMFSYTEGVGENSYIPFIIFVSFLSSAVECVEENGVQLWGYQGCYPIVLGIKDTKEQNFKLYPNPATNNVFIEHNYTDSKIFRLYNAQGQLVLMQKVDSSIEKINISELEKGIYWYRLDTLYQGKVIIN
ncbi:MAG: T9SS type A sorting domain-containing protein [Aureispira sp.]|nr:T9SS type A sorting domain-containing protein [Aureispira sp.]